MICVNFFDQAELCEAFEKLYSFGKDEIVKLAVMSMQQCDPALYFVEQTKMNIDMIDTKNVYLHCKHITTSLDNLESFKKYGFMTLNELLSKKTSLSSFLKEHQIHIDVSNKKVCYKNKCFVLNDSNEECNECFYETDCQHKTSLFSNNTTLIYRDMACSFRDSIKVLRSKLYDDTGEIEVHLAGSKENVHDYSEIKRHPEILITIENLISELFNEKIYLCRDWEEETGGKYYCMDFDVNIVNFERITTTLDEYNYFPFLDYCQNEYSSLDDVNTNFLVNIFLLYNGIPHLAFEEKWICGQILPDTKIPYKSITVTEFQN